MRGVNFVREKTAFDDGDNFIRNIFTVRFDYSVNGYPVSYYSRFSKDVDDKTLRLYKSQVKSDFYNECVKLKIKADNINDRILRKHGIEANIPINLVI